MLKKILAFVAMLYAAASFAAVDVNKASPADLDGIKGIGPGISAKIVDERKKGNFKDWPDFIERVKGVGEANATKFSEAGLTVNGQVYKASGAPAAKKDAKMAASAPADDKAKKAEEAKAKKAEAAKAKEEAKAKAAADKKMKADADKKAKDDAKAKPAAAKPASAPASAASAKK